MRVTLNRAEYVRLTQSRSGPVVRHVSRLSRRVAGQAKRNVRVDTGNLRSTVHHTVDPGPTRVVGTIGSPVEYGLYLHEGTGIYGPRRRPIRPVRAKALRFTVRSGQGGKTVVFARQVKGVKGDKWLVRALRSAQPYPVRERTAR